MPCFFCYKKTYLYHKTRYVAYDTRDEEGQKTDDIHFVARGRCAIDNEPQFHR